jgi:predicted transcriptional regulator
MLISGRYIRQLREEQGLSQAELARHAGISQAHVAKIENEKTDPRLSTVNRMLQVLSKKKEVVRCGDIMSRHIITAHADDSIHKAGGIMRRFAYSQLPVFQGRKLVGSIRESTIVRNMHRNLKNLQVKHLLDQPFPVVSADDPVDMLESLFEFQPAVLVSEKGKIVGIITKTDLLRI